MLVEYETPISEIARIYINLVSKKDCFPLSICKYSDVSIKNIDILPNRQYIAYTADSAQEQYS